MKNCSAFSLSLTCLLSGVILGFLLSPIKKGIEIENNSGNHYYRPKGSDTNI